MYFKKLCRGLQRSSSIFQWSLMLGPRCTLEFLIHGVGTDRNSSKFWGLGCPVGPNKDYKMRGASPPTPTCWQGLWGRRGSSSPRNRPGRPKNHVKHRCAGSTRGPRPNSNETLRFGPHCTLRFLIHGFGDDRDLLVLGVWATPAAPKTFPKCEGLRPHTYEGLLELPGPPKPQTKTRFESAQKPRVKNRCAVSAEVLFKTSETLRFAPTAH